MNYKGRLAPGVFLCGWLFSTAAFCQPQVSLQLQHLGTNVNLTWPSSVEFQGTAHYPEYTVEHSTDLKHWSGIGGKVRGLPGVSGPQLKVRLNAGDGPSFFRLGMDLSAQTEPETGSGGAEVFGYGSQFAKELAAIGNLSVEAFSAGVPRAPYLPQLTWDPATAAFWTNFNGNPSFQLSADELAIFSTNGFVVSERLGNSSFAQVYHKIFAADLPVFVTTDSILQAWHRSYLRMLEELEEIHLSTLLESMLTNMSAQLPQTWQQYGSGPLGNSILDADYYLGVARSLWTGQQVPSALGLTAQNQRIATALGWISAEKLAEVPLFSYDTTRLIDFSQFKPRGHYDSSDRLRRYFKAMMWCGRIDLRVAIFNTRDEDDIRQLGTALVMHHLLTQSGQLEKWAMLEKITGIFVGITDSMTVAQFGGLLDSAGIGSPADVTSLVVLTNLQTQLLTGELGVQNILGEALEAPLKPEQMKLPRSFTLAGQKFIMDSWAFSQTVFDKISWEGFLVKRRKPSCLDVAFSVLGNDQTVDDLVRRLQDTNGVPFRDGLPYQHNLLAARRVIDAQNNSIWTNNIYTAWLAALRALSAPTTGAEYPEAMRTRAWGMKTLNTQLASWTELRHDTVLYAKQSYTPPVTCDYPYGFVEPRPEFWTRMRELAEVTANALAELHLQGVVTTMDRDPDYPQPTSYDLATINNQQVNFLRLFAGRMHTLQVIAEKELAQQPLSPEETEFLRNTIEDLPTYMGLWTFSGWYPGLFYRNCFTSPLGDEESDIWDALATDVHTDTFDEQVGDPGAIIHEGVGNVHLLMIAVDNGPDRRIYAGPALSHYEFEMPPNFRLTDSEWQARLLSAEKPPSPEWTRSYLVPKP